MGHREPCRMANGETMPQIMAVSRHFLSSNTYPNGNVRQRSRAEVPFKRFAKLKEAYRLSMKLTELFNKKSIPEQASLNMTRWYNDVETFGENEFARVLETFESHHDTITILKDG